MATSIATEELGTKHECPSCGIKYYDLGKTEIVCPKCGAAPDEEGAGPASAGTSAAQKKKKKKKKAAGKKKTASKKTTKKKTAKKKTKK